MNIIDAINNRRAVRQYLPDKVDKETIGRLLKIAVRAPTAMHEEPWGFLIIQDKDILNRLSETAKNLVRSQFQQDDSEDKKRAVEFINKTDFNVFHNASTLIVICAQFQGPFVEADCWLAAENLMLAAHAEDLGTCVIGFAISALNTPEWKKEFNLSEKMTAVVPIIIGVPAEEKPASSRKAPHIIAWK